MIGRINIVKMFILPKGIYKFSSIPIKIAIAFFSHRNRTNNPKAYMEPWKNPNSKNNLDKE